MKFRIDKYLLIMPFIVWSSLPALAYNKYARFIVLISIFTFFFLSIIKVSINNKLKIRWIYIFIPIVIVYMFSTHLYFSTNQYCFWHLQNAIYLIFVIVSKQIIEDNPKSIMVLIVTILVTNIITVFLTLHALQIDQNTARAFSRSNDISREISESGIGGYGLVYSNLALFPLFFAYLKKLIVRKDKNIYLIALLLVNIIFASLLLIKAQYTLALLMAALLIFFIIIANVKYKYFILLIYLFILAIGLNSYFNADSDYIIFTNILEGTRYEEKINTLINIIFENNTSKSFGPRLDRYILSAETFISYPLIGSLAFDPDIIGMHSDFLDKFAQWGIGVGTLILFLILYLPINIYSYTSKTKNENKEFLLFVVVIIFIGLFNTIPMQLSISLVLSACYVSYFRLNAFPYYKYQKRLTLLNRTEVVK